MPQRASSVISVVESDLSPTLETDAHAREFFESEEEQHNDEGLRRCQ